MSENVKQQDQAAQTIDDLLVVIAKSMGRWVAAKVFAEADHGEPPKDLPEGTVPVKIMQVDEEQLAMLIARGAAVALKSSMQGVAARAQVSASQGAEARPEGVILN